MFDRFHLATPITPSLKVGCTVFCVNWHTGVQGVSTIVGETPAYWRLDNAQMALKRTLKIKGPYEDRIQFASAEELERWRIFCASRVLRPKLSEAIEFLLRRGLRTDLELKTAESMVAFVDAIREAEKGSKKHG